ncbi:MAG: D-glycero-beta-D-manno-heptose 1-phosphate adenylyltransferase [candidate division WOR-3 bacterium]
MIVSRKKIKEIVKKLKKEGKKIVFTNGCFDLIHKGHIYLLKEAKKFGDVLIVGLNSDSSIKKIKGKGRPILKEKERGFIIDNIKGVDYVVIFNEKTPFKLIKEIKPDILVKGGDYKENEVVGGEFVKKRKGRVVIIPYLKNFSTTKIIERIKYERT